MADASSALQKERTEVERFSQIVDESNSQITRLKDEVSSLEQSLEESSTKIIELQVQNLLKANQLESQTEAVQGLACEFEIDMIEMQKRLQLFHESLPLSSPDSSDSEDPVYPKELLAK
ncbi:hypothetical protein Moror_4194 [Moniliophthora roreri MCA 2997]|uniref:Uncharacterized protein n=2 Tax=Moniliophthora roreri TaxID=221103 RepID=V2XDS4_MONRO|nr:hypothetical protein Moror_4194 [Moniliophthora roreri MCA 2997]